ncbi:MAG: Lcl domain-containing protein [Gammaproteobacteria bacterium]
MKSCLRGALSVSIVLSCVLTGVQAAPVSGQGTWETTLQARHLNGNPSTVEAYYDTALNITWLANANYAGTTMVWTTANSWAASLNINGYTGWRLPTTTDTGTPGCNFAYSGTDCGFNVDTASSELAHMFYTTLGDKAYYSSSGVPSQPGFGLTNTGPFSNLQASGYWSATEYAPNAIYAWTLSFYSGGQGYANKIIPMYAWAVHSGDIAASTVPMPAAVWLFGSGLGVLAGVSRKRQP